MKSQGLRILIDVKKTIKAMSFPDNIPTFTVSPHRISSESDAIDVRHQFPMISEPFDQHSAFDDQPSSFKRPRISETYPSRIMNQPQNQPMKGTGTGHLFFKTRLCAKFKTGNCRNGENCNFAHGLDDIREPSPNWQALVGVRVDQSTGNWDEDQRIIHRMKICKKYYNGEECTYGDNCNFLHEDPSKFREDVGVGGFRESAAISIGTIGSPPKSYGHSSNGLEGNRTLNFGLNAFRGNGKPVYWKTKLCTKWETTGQCNFREDCHFAHGIAELQAPGGGQIEAETPCVVPTMPKAVIPTMLKALPVSANKAPITSTTCTASLHPANEERPVKKNCLLRWNGSKKINCIYGDWIDDLPIVALGK